MELIELLAREKHDGHVLSDVEVRFYNDAVTEEEQTLVDGIMTLNIMRDK